MEIVKQTKKGRKVYRDSEGNEYLDCNLCKSVKPLTDFINKTKGFYGKGSNCKKCDHKRIEEWKERNPDKARAIVQRNNARRRGKPKSKPSSEEIRQKRLYEGHVYRTRRRNMSNTLTEDQYEIIINKYDRKCCLTGRSEVHLDHVIPLATGHAGTTYENMIPLAGELNSSKNAYNIFEWAKDKHNYFGFSMERFNEVMAEVAERNQMSFEKFKNYVYSCHANPNTVETHYNQSQWYISFYNRLEKAIEMYKNGAEPKQEIPIETGISQSTLLSHLQKRGIPRRSGSKADWKERLEKAIELYKQGYSYRKVHEMTGTHKNTISREAKKRGIDRQFGKHANEELVEKAIEKYIKRRENGENISTILNNCGVSKKRLYAEIDKRGLRKQIIKCAYCGEEFKATPKQRYCNYKCSKNKYYRENK
jgi:transposase